MLPRHTSPSPPRIPSPSSSLSDSSSLMSLTTTPVIPGMATLTTFTGGKDAPLLEVGNPTASLFDEFHDAALVFFRKHKITDGHDKVCSVLNCFHDPCIDSWIKNNKLRINENTYTFDDLLSDLCKRFLDPHWAKNMHRTVVNSKMSAGETFETFVTRVMAGNNLLDGNPLHLSHAQLRIMVEGNMASYLADHIDDLTQEEQDRLAAIVDYNDWETEIKRIDRKFHANYQHFLHLHSLHQNHSASEPSSQKHMSESLEGPPLKHPKFVPSATSSYPATGSNAINMGDASSKPFSSTFRVPCPAITNEERAVCREFSGCHKCRQLFVEHKSINCPNGYPDGHTYRPLTHEMGIQLATRRAIAATYSQPTHPPS